MLRRRILSVIVAIASFAAMATPALAGPEWCDDGSPVPNDFRLRPTGAGSVVAPLDWLHSTRGGTIDVAAGSNTLVGGVAHGMSEALEHARPYASLPNHD